ncbi:Ig-like domain-containing protein [Pyxidicoccus sp. 3LFB2]
MQAVSKSLRGSLTALTVFCVSGSVGCGAEQDAPETPTGPTQQVRSRLGEPTVELVAPLAASFVRGTVQLVANATDDSGVLDRVEFYDGTTLIGSATVAPYSVAWDTVAAAAGAHTLTAQAFDLDGNAATSAAVVVNVDNQGPALVITSPVPSSPTNNFVRGIVPVRATASDAAGITAFGFSVGGTATHNGNGTYSSSWDTRTRSDGAYGVFAQARDSLGNMATSTPVTVRVDNTPPAVSIMRPLANSQVSGIVTITVYASDSGALGSSVFTVDGATVFSGPSVPTNVPWDSTGKPGNHYIQVRVTDLAGNSRTTGVSVTVL